MLGLCIETFHTIAARAYLLGIFTLGGLLLLLVLVLGSRRPGQGLLKNLKNLFVRDLLVGLDLFEVEGWGSRQSGQAVLGDS